MIEGCVGLIVLAVILFLGFILVKWVMSLIGFIGLVALVVLGIGGWLFYLYREEQVRLKIDDNLDLKVKRSLGDDGELIVADKKSGTRIFTFQGKGTQVMHEAVYLNAGTYRLKYQFPHPAMEKQYHGKDWDYIDVPSVKVEAIAVAQNEPILIMETSSKGSQTFSMEADGRYVFQVTCHPDSHMEKWKIECTKL